MVQWSPPAGASRYVDGYVNADEVVVLGHITGELGPAAAEIRLARNEGDEIDGGELPTTFELARPSDCDTPGALIQDMSFSRAAGVTSYAATWDDCAADTRRLYLSIEGEPQLVREGAKKDASLALGSFARAGNALAIGFFDGSSSSYSFGGSVADLNRYLPVVLGDADSTNTALAGLFAVSPNAVGAYWTVFTEGDIVPVQVLGKTVTSDKLGMIDDEAGYAKITEYLSLPDVTVWGRPSVGAGTIVVGGTDLDGSVARFSILSASGAPLILDREVAAGPSQSIGSLAAAHFGPNGVLVAWQSLEGSALTVRGRIFECK